MRLREQIPELLGATYWINGDTTKEKLVGENPTLIHFWSVSCYMCKEMMGEVNKLRDKYMKLNIVAVHIPLKTSDQDVDLIRSSAIAHNITHSIYVDNAMRMKYAFGNNQVPAYYLFDKEGELRHFQAGKSGMRILENRVNRLLNDLQ